MFNITKKIMNHFLHQSYGTPCKFRMYFLLVFFNLSKNIRKKTKNIDMKTNGTIVWLTSKKSDFEPY